MLVALKTASCSLENVQSNFLSLSHMHSDIIAVYINKQLSSMSFCDMFAHVSTSRCFKSLVSRSGVLYARSYISAQIR